MGSLLTRSTSVPTKGWEHEKGLYEMQQAGLPGEGALPGRDREPCTWHLAVPDPLPGAASEGGEGRVQGRHSETRLPSGGQWQSLLGRGTGSAPSPVMFLWAAEPRGSPLWRGGSVHWEERAVGCTQDWLGWKFLPLLPLPSILTLQEEKPAWFLTPQFPFYLVWALL